MDANVDTVLVFGACNVDTMLVFGACKQLYFRSFWQNQTPHHNVWN